MRIVGHDLGTVRAPWGAAVRSGLDVAGLTLRAVSKRLGVSRQYVARLLAGAPTIPADHFQTLCELAGIDPTEFCDPKDPWQNPSSPPT